MLFRHEEIEGHPDQATDPDAEERDKLRSGARQSLSCCKRDDQGKHGEIEQTAQRVDAEEAQQFIPQAPVAIEVMESEMAVQQIAGAHGGEIGQNAGRVDVEGRLVFQQIEQTRVDERDRAPDAGKAQEGRS